MFGSDLYIALTLGVILALIFSETTGISPGGLVVPGYLALVVDQPVTLTVVFLISVLDYLFVTKVLSRFAIIYGSRKLAAMLIVGITLKLLFDYFYPVMPFEIYEFRGIGVIVPGLIANTYQRQGIPLTLVGTFVVTFATFLLLALYRMVA